MLRPRSEARVALRAVGLSRSFPNRGLTMKDVLFLVVTAAFFAVAFLYAKSFDHL